MTFIEVVDEATIWSQDFDKFSLETAEADLDYLIAQTPMLICAIATEIGFRFEGVGTIFWAHFDEAVGCSASMTQRQRIAAAFREQADRYNLSHPAPSAFSEHFSNIAWPIANALLPHDLVGPVTRLLARGPMGDCLARDVLQALPVFAPGQAWPKAHG